ncbi:hypothetical protein Tco_1453567 [Tanacetum coccineum]
MELDTIPETESDKVIKSSVEDLVPIPRDSEGISDDTCDVPFCDNSPPLDVLNDHFEIFSDFNDDCTSSDDDYFEDIDYVEASPPDYELVSIEEAEDDILRAKLSNIYLLIAKIESSGSTTTYAKNSLPEYDSFHFEIESDQGELSRVVMETINEIDALLDIDVSTDLEDGYHDSEGDIIYLESLLINNTIPNFSPEVFFDHEQKCLKDEPNNLIMESLFLLSSRCEDSIFDPGISAFHFSSLKPAASHRSGTIICVNVYPNILYEIPMEICSSTCVVPNITMIWGESS